MTRSLLSCLAGPSIRRFVTVALFAAGMQLGLPQARAAETVCGGTDLLAKMQEDDPAALSALRRKAAEIPNGTGLLWKIDKPGLPVSFLYGTMHLTDPRVRQLSPAAADAFERSATVVIETTDILDQSALLAAMTADPELTMFTDGRSLASVIPSKDLPTVREALDARGLSLQAVARMKPWMLSALLALPACEHARRGAGEVMLDVELARKAQSSGKALAGLETARSQFEAMASLPMDLHVRGLVEASRHGEMLEDVVETMVTMYLAGEIAMIRPLFEASAADGSYGAFEATIITARNRTMAKAAKAYLDRGSAFIAVGALHLPGSDGLIELLRNQGYTVEAVPLR